MSGIALALIGAAIATIFSGIGSAKGVGMTTEAGMGVLAEDSSKFGKLLVLELLPGTQGLYGFLTAFLALNRMGVIGSGFEPLSIEKGLMMFAACMPIAIVGYFSAIAQGKTAAAGVSIIAKKPDQNGKAITMAAMVETYAVIALLVSILSIFSISGLNI